MCGLIKRLKSVRESSVILSIDWKNSEFSVCLCAFISHGGAPLVISIIHSTQLWYQRLRSKNIRFSWFFCLEIIMFGSVFWIHHWKVFDKTIVMRQKPAQILIDEPLTISPWKVTFAGEDNLKKPDQPISEIAKQPHKFHKFQNRH
jgi:hypothetical protein